MAIGTVAELLLALVVIIVVARVLGLLCRRIGQPQVIGEIAAGILLGPTLFHGALTRTLFPAEIRPALATIAGVGICVFMFLVGLHLADSRLRGQSRIVLAVSIGSMVVPFVLGSLFAIGIVGDRSGQTAVLFCLFLGTAMSVTAFPVLARILTDRQLIDKPIGGLALAVAAVGDVLAWSMLSVLVALSNGNQPPWRLLLVVPFVALLVGVVRPALARLARRRPAEQKRGAAARISVSAGLLVALGGALWLSSAATSWMGLHQIFGAFLLGAVMPRSGADGLRERVLPWVERIDRTVLLPPFFVVAGFAVNLSGMDAGAFGLLLLILLIAIGGKMAGAFTAARLVRVSPRHSVALALLVNTRGLTELIVLAIGLQMGLLDERLYSLLVLMALVTTSMAGLLLPFVYPRQKAEPDHELRSADAFAPLVKEESR
ncbi:cation:proton antiporter [Streptomyces sp. H10-C2]|uniref:cation:proton antiporter domain-containing protein n=1 Tax=unclassified Streptomyces TaxID=2593676 RepID=UPI0024BA1B11|nr:MULTISPECIES: cation:proton antiporter [unclassified Streptomyces]MDJ0344784.1 cation:proton antiporter [Streptomyces sp. PH10-H1]MDJ0369669.1 cation:proton antiporter [Streptomyces sp. H10-C2]